MQTERAGSGTRRAWHRAKRLFVGIFPCANKGKNWKLRFYFVTASKWGFTQPFFRTGTSLESAGSYLLEPRLLFFSGDEGSAIALCL